MDKVYIVRAVRDTDYGFRDISGVYASREAAQRFIDSIGGNGSICLCSGEEKKMYIIEEWKVKAFGDALDAISDNKVVTEYYHTLGGFGQADWSVT